MFATYASVAAIQAASADADALTFAEILTNVPRDPASVFTYLLVAAALGGILWFGRPPRPRAPGGA